MAPLCHSYVHPDLSGFEPPFSLDVSLGGKGFA